MGSDHLHRKALGDVAPSTLRSPRPKATRSARTFSSLALLGSRTSIRKVSQISHLYPSKTGRPPQSPATA